MDALGHQRFAVAGHDTGMWIGYALAADHPGRVARLAVAETPLPGVSPSPPLFANAHLNNALWHFAFNRLAAVNDQLVAGREEIYFGWQFATKAARPLPEYAVRHYIGTLAASPEALHASFAIYRALDTTIAQNQQRTTRRLSMPVLGIGGEHSLGDQVADTMKLAADDVQALVIPGCAHWVPEEAPRADADRADRVLGPVPRRAAPGKPPRASGGPGLAAPAEARPTPKHSPHASPPPHARGVTGTPVPVRISARAHQLTSTTAPCTGHGRV